MVEIANHARVTDPHQRSDLLLERALGGIAGSRQT
jgi:hypothetical protein